MRDSNTTPLSGPERLTHDGTRVLLSIQNVTKKVWDGRTRRTVVDDASLDIDAGEWVVLRGASGSGKTTLLAMLGAMLRPTSGEIVLDGEPTSRLRDAHRAEFRRTTVGFVFQDLQLIEDLDVLQNVLLPFVPVGVKHAHHARAEALLARFEMSALANVQARKLSGGERQRVAIARALLGDPKLLLLDEPTAHLDDARAAKLLEEIASIARDGRAVVTATHDARVTSAAGVTRVIELHDGRVIAAHAAEAE
jgi:putative ABC transport system ATP-binding protein